MIESALFFALGLLCAAFLALIFMPAVLRRVAVLTRKRIESELPMSLNELQAEKDKLRAGFATHTRRLEIEIERFREASAAHLVESGRSRERMKALVTANAEKDSEIATLRRELAALSERIERREADLAAVSEELAVTREDLASRRKAYDTLDRQYLKASTTADNRQIELVAKETKVDRFADEIAELRRARKDAETRMHEATMHAKEQEEVARSERSRHAALEARLEELMSAIADRDEMLERRAMELARLRDQHRGAMAEAEALKRAIEEGQAQRAALERKLSEAEAPGLATVDLQPSGVGPTDARARLEAELQQVMADKQAVLGRLAAMERAAGKRDQQTSESEALREQIKDLAAEVVHITAQLEGPDSPILKALEEAERLPIRIENGRTVISIADRVQALRKGAGLPG